jgi:hypothetical protein
MRVFLAIGLAAAAMLATASTAAAYHETDDLRCNGTYTGLAVEDVTVPTNGVCVLIDSSVIGKVRVKQDAYFEASDSTVAGRIESDRATTVFVHDGSIVGRGIRAKRTQQVLAFDSTIVRGDLRIERTPQDFGKINVCGMRVYRGDIDVERSGSDILIGDPLTAGCAGNTVKYGDIEVERNFTDVELTVRGNTVGDDLIVTDNKGPSDKVVADNKGGDRLRCRDNRSPFSASNNTGWNRKEGQCA